MTNSDTEPKQGEKGRIDMDAGEWRRAPELVPRTLAEDGTWVPQPIDVVCFCGRFQTWMARLPHDNPVGYRHVDGSPATPACRGAPNLFAVGGPVDRVLRLLGTDEGSEQVISRSKARSTIESIVTGKMTVAEVDAWIRSVIENAQ